MLVIRATQMESLAGPADEDGMVAAAIRHLRRHSAEYVVGVSEEGLRRHVRAGVRRARGHGFTRVEDVLTFVDVMHRVAPNFDEQPELRAVLADASIPAAGKWAVLTRSQFDAAWEAARADYRPSAWSEGVEDDW